MKANHNNKNWYLNTSPDAYVPNDSVIFNNQGMAKPDIKLVGNLPVSNVLVNSSGNYSLSGSGTISGTSGLTKQGAGKLTILNNNIFPGKSKTGRRFHRNKNQCVCRRTFATWKS
jgi:hypothetical protein